MTYSNQIAQELNVRPAQVSATIDLLDAGNTLPFIARYRKEMTGALDEDQIRRLSESLARLRALDERRATMLTTIEAQGKLTPELRAQIDAAATLTTLEDLYLPYRPKRRTRAIIARERGLQGLADLILQQPKLRQSLDEIAAPYLNDDVPTSADAYAGARDIVAETINDHAGVRGTLREKALKWGVLHSEKIEDAADEKQRLRDLLRFRRARRPHPALSGAGDQSRRKREGAARPARRRRARLVNADPVGVSRGSALAAGRAVGTRHRRCCASPRPTGDRARRAGGADRSGRNPRD